MIFAATQRTRCIENIYYIYIYIEKNRTLAQTLFESTSTLFDATAGDCAEEVCGGDHQGQLASTRNTAQASRIAKNVALAAQSIWKTFAHNEYNI